MNDIIPAVIKHDTWFSSDKIDKLALALSKAQNEFDTPIKDKVNPHFKSKFASLLSIINATKKGLSNNGLAVSQLVSSEDMTATITTVLMHSSGQYIGSVLKLKSTQATPQGMGSAITHGKRYARAAILDVDADEDDDANEASKNDSGQKDSGNKSKEVKKQVTKEPEVYTGKDEHKIFLNELFKEMGIEDIAKMKKAHEEFLQEKVKVSDMKKELQYFKEINFI